MIFQYLYSTAIRDEELKRSPFHLHNCYQLEYLCGPPVLLKAGMGETELPRECLLLIPPGVLHGFRYSPSGHYVISVKFQIEPENTQESKSPRKSLSRGDPVPKMPCDFRLLDLSHWPEDTKCVIRAISEFADQSKNFYSNRKGIMNGLLLALLEQTFLDSPESCSEESRPERIIGYIKSHVRENPRVEDIARALNLSENYTSHLGRELFGKPLKSVIDDCRTEEMKAALRYSDLSLSSVADGFGFSDIYSFSRFFKRCAGISPGKWRRIKPG